MLPLRLVANWVEVVILGLEEGVYDMRPMKRRPGLAKEFVSSRELGELGLHPGCRVYEISHFDSIPCLDA